MTDENYPRVKDIFLHACDLEGEQLERYLREACGEDDGLRQEVLSLLSFHMPDTLIGGSSDTNAGNLRPSTVIDLAAWVGRRLGKYEVTRVLDSGGMGTVLEAYDTAIDRLVAIKVLNSELSENELMRQRFLAEARAAGKLSHSNAVTVYEVGTEGGVSYLVMEYAEAGSAADRLDRDGPFTPPEATRLMSDAVRGIAAAHAEGLVHRDIKPANLLLKSDGGAMVSDFGIAKLTTSQSLQITRAGQIVGTPNFMSPEQCQGTEVDPRSDIYSLGATYFSLLTGKVPYEKCGSLVSLINAHCHTDPPDPREIERRIPAGCAAIVARAMATSPGDRYQTADEMLAALEDYENAGQPRPLKRAATRRRMLLAGALAIPAAVLAGVYLARSPSVPTAPSDPTDPTDPTEGPSGRAGLTPSPPAAPAEPIRIGIVHSLSGTMARSEEVIVDAYRLAIAELNARGGVRGRPIESVVADGHSSGAVFANEARRLIEDRGVCTLFGCCTSASRKSVKEVVEANDHLLIYPVNHEGVEASPNIIYLGGDPSQTVIPCVQWAYAFDHKRSFFLVGSDYVYPRIANTILKEQLESMGATLTGEAYLPLGSTDVRGVVDQIAAAGPDAIVNTISGDSQAAFVRSLRARGVTATQFATGIGEQELRSTRISNVVGDYSVGTYFQSIDTPENQAFVERFHAKFGKQRVINSSMETAYAAVMLWAGAANEAVDLSPAAIRDAMLRQSYLAPSGLMRIDPETHYAYRKSYLGRVEADGQFRIAWSSPDAIAPDPFPGTRTRGQWDAMLGALRKSWGGQWAAPADAGN